MNLRALKTWHWVMIRLIAGAVVGITRVMQAAQDPVGGRGFITQHQFEDAVHAPAINGQPYVADITIHPCPSTDQLEIVHLHAFDADANGYREYLFAAPRLFVPSGPPRGRAPTSVLNYLNELAAANPALKPRNAWWDANWATVGFYALLGCAVIGAIWPALLRLIDGPPPKDPAYDLNQFKREAETGPDGVTAADEDHLRALEEEMATALGDAPPGRQPVGATTTPVRKLESERLEAAAPLPHEHKDFAGEYYPVEKHPVEKHSPHGFSLVELIVVIGIVTLLIAFALPALRYARMSAETVKCASNLRSIGQALHAYANENHGSLPAWSGWHYWPQTRDDAESGPAWTVEMIPYLGKPDSPIYNCPSFPLPAKYRNYFLESQWSGASGRSSMKLTDITMVGRFVLSGDTTNMGHYRPDVKDDDSDPDDFGGGMLAWPSTGGIFMHLGGNNVLFDDGHVSLYAAFNPMEITFNPHRMESNGEVTPD